MLNILRRIIQEFSDNYDPLESMRMMVSEVKMAVHADATAVYFYDRKNERYILLAAEGFKNDVTGKLTIKRGEGLVGWIGEREEPISLDNASRDPHYKYFPETGEEIYKSFLGVPIIHQRELLGVIVVQQKAKRKFDENEEAFVVTVAAQVGGVIAHAKLTGMISNLTAVAGFKKNENIIEGISGSYGVAMGTAKLAYVPADIDSVPSRQIQDINKEILLFEQALEHTKVEVEKLCENLVTLLPPEEYLLFDAYSHILSDDHLTDEIISEIQQGEWAQGAVKKVIKKHISFFDKVEDPYIRERSADIRDIGQRIIANLQKKEALEISYPEKTVLVGKEVTASALAEVPAQNLAGLISIGGSPNAHVAIVARALNIPTIMGARNLDLDDIEGKEVFLDAYNGNIYIEPSKRLRKELLKVLSEEQELYSGLNELKDLKAETPDGHVVELFLNTGMLSDFFTLSNKTGAEGVGLYRTEVPFMIRDRFPSEKEQRLLYKNTLENFYPMPVVMRTLDIGGDKILPYFQFKEDNPFLGWRGIRVTLDHPEIFLVQIRAMLSASYSFNNLRIMLPMITNINELLESKKLISQAFDEIVDEGLEIMVPKIGIMVEVPSVVYEIERFVKEVDFISVGTNDLIQYMLAVDRNNARVSGLYDHFNPAILKALNTIVGAAHHQDIDIKASVCGEMASDPLAAILLLGMGYDFLSMNSNSIPKIKWVIRNFKLSHSREILAEVLTMQDSSEVRNFLKIELEKAGLGGLVRAGK